MGCDKAAMLVQGRPMAERIVSELLAAGLPVTALGRPVMGADWIEDSKQNAGPLMALSGFMPRNRSVFVCSCDLPLFDRRLPGVLTRSIEGFQAAVPVIEGMPQPLCALYDGSCWSRLHSTLDEGRRSMMAWLEAISWKPITAEVIGAHGIDPFSVIGVNTPEELILRMSPFGNSTV
jgi:molybdopterin-guanine dinucleotide biosynthesis protein A